MTSSARCSTSAPVAVLLAAAFAAGCGHRAPAPARQLGPAEPGARPRVAVLPVHNITGNPFPAKELRAAVERALGGRLEVVPADELEPFLARHRLRHTGGIDAASARAAREELGAIAVLVTTVTTYHVALPPTLGLSVRLVSTADEPEILWMDSFGWAGDQAPGLLGLGKMDEWPPVEARVLGELARSLGAFLAGEQRSGGCDSGRFGPKARYRSPELDVRERHTVAVVPFLDRSRRGDAGEMVALEFVHQLVAAGRYRVLEPGVVRDYLLRARVFIPGGVSVETTRLVLGGLEADLVLSGMVLDFDEGGGGGAAIRFHAVLLDSDGEVLWNSSSYNRGDDGVFMFGLGRVGNSQDLTCRMVSGVMDRLDRPGGTPVVWDRAKDPRALAGRKPNTQKAGSAGR